ncbi:hypothetical protein LCGC14_2115880, partial [marine sediment metagenome]
LWSLPTVRLLAARHKTPVDFMTSPKYGSILDLIQPQTYILKTRTNEKWDVQETAPMTPRVPPARDDNDYNADNACVDYEAIYHLGYQKWPSRPLAEEIRVETLGGGQPGDPQYVSLDTPWINMPDATTRTSPGPVVAVGFTNEHIELKMGVLCGLVASLPEISWRLVVPDGRAAHRAWEWERFTRAWPENFTFWQTSWVQAAHVIATADLFFGCLSAPWVLANAVGTPTVIMEPSPERHNPIFWRESPKNHLVVGNDGKPTFDLRHTCDMIAAVLEEVENA